MRRRLRGVLLARALWEMARYDVISKLSGFPGVRRRMKPARAVAAPSEAVHRVCDAVGCVSSFYWKPLLCLQRSVVTARLLRAAGVQADVVIGCRHRPFFSHAWVEVGGRVVNDSSAYRTRLEVLDRF
jgi:hypothetical protein